MQVERGLLVAIREVPSGEWVSNTWVTCLEEWDNSSKGLLIPDVTTEIRRSVIEGEIHFERGLRPIS